MAELQVRVVVDRSGYDSSVSKINSRLKQLSSTPIKLRFEATGVDEVTKSALKLANAQARIAAAQAKSDAARAKEATANARATAATEARIAAEKRLQTQIEKNSVVGDQLRIQVEKTATASNRAAAEIAKTGRAAQDLAMQQEKTAQSANRVAAAQERTKQSVSAVAKEQEKTAQSANKLAAAQTSAASANEKSAQTAANAESAYSRLGVTLSNFVKIKAFQALSSGISGSVAEMKKLDSELVTVRKVADATQQQLEEISEGSYENAAKYGRNPSDYAAGVAEFNRAGYRETAEALAELSIKTQLVGDMNAKTANQFLLATDAAYKYKGSVTQLSTVLDGMNAIDNNFATSIEKIAAGLGKVAPIASQAHVGIDELSAAIGTITAVTQRSGEEAATALRALFLNIMGDTKTEIEDGATWTAGEIAGLRDLMKKYIPEIVAEADRLGKVINPMEAIGALSRAMSEGILTEQELVQQVSDIGGKLRSSQLLAIVQNWELYSEMLNTYKTAAGSADKEVEKMMDSWEAKGNRLNASFNKLMSHFFNAEIAKDGLDALRTAVEFLDSDFGHAVITAGMLAAGVAGVHTAATKLAKVFSNPLGATGWLSVATIALGAFVGIIDQIIVDYDELVEQSEKAQKTYEEEKAKLDAINTELETANTRIKELQDKGSLTFVEQQELDRLSAATKELEEQKKLQEEIVLMSQRESAYAAADVIDKYSDYDRGATAFSKKRYGFSLFGLVPDTKDLNQLVAAKELAQEMLRTSEDMGLAGKDVLLEYNSRMQDIRASAAATSTELDEFISQNKAYYDFISREENAGIRGREDIAFMDEYKKAMQMRKEISEFFFQEDFSKEYLPDYESAAKYVVDYMETLEKGGEEEQKIKDAFAELNEQIGDVQGYDTAIDRVQKLGQEYGLTAESVNTLIQAARLLATDKNGLGYIFFPEEMPSAVPTTANGSNTQPVQAAKEYSTLSGAISTARDRFVHLKEAMQEAEETGRVSEYTFAMLERLGVDLGNVLKDDLAGGFVVSKDAIREAGNETAELLKELTGSEFAFEEATQGAEDFADAVENAEKTLSDLRKELEEMGESGDPFREYRDSYEEVMQLLAEGRTGTNAFAALSRNLLSGDKVEEIGSDARQMGEFLNSELIAGLLGDEKSASELAQFMAENFEGVGASFEDIGGEVKATVTDWDAFSRSVGLSVDVLKSLFGYLDESSETMRDIGVDSSDASAKVSGLAQSIANAASGTVEIDVDSEDADTDIDNTAEKVDNLSKEHNVGFTASTREAERRINELQDAVDKITGKHDIAFAVTTVPHQANAYASGTRNATAGTSLVNENGPELIVSKTGAYIAADGRPALVNLGAGDTVYTSKETESILAGTRALHGAGASNADSGLAPSGGSSTSNSALAALVGALIGSASGSNSPITTIIVPTGGSQSGSGVSGGSGGGSGGGSQNDSTDWWRIVEDHYSDLLDGRNREIDRLEYEAELLRNDLEDLTRPLETQISQLERVNAQIDRRIELLEREREQMVKPLEDELEALKDAREEREAQVTLEEKQKAIEEARAALQNAQNERNIRYYNAEKGQWEWMADQKAVAEAEDALKKAEQDLADFEYDQQIAALDQQIEDIESAYDAEIEKLEGNGQRVDDAIYALEQQIEAAELAYQEAVRPLEDKIRELERILAAIEQEWADAEVPYNKPEGDLQEALANIGGTAAEIGAVNAVFEALAANNAIQVPTSPPDTMGSGFTALVNSGLMFGLAAERDYSAASYSKTSNVVTHDNSGAIYIGSLAIHGDPHTMTVSDLFAEAGIYVQQQ